MLRRRWLLYYDEAQATITDSRAGSGFILLRLFFCHEPSQDTCSDQLPRSCLAGLVLGSEPLESVVNCGRFDLQSFLSDQLEYYQPVLVGE
jgi:hypothetical protein